MDLFAVEHGIFDEILKNILNPEAEYIVYREKYQGYQNRNEALVFQLQADFCHDPAQ